MPTPTIGTRTSVAEDVAEIRGWIARLLDDVVVSPVLTPEPFAATSEERVDMVVLDVAPVEDRRPDRSLPVRLRVTYLLAVAGPDPIAAADRLVVLVAALPDQPWCEVVAEPVSDGWWRSFGAAPRPAVRLRTLLVLPRVEVARAPLVTEPLVVEVAGLAPLVGSAVGPHGRPLGGASVRLTTTGLRTETDRHGRFSFAAVSTEHPLDLTVTAAGTTYAGVVPARTVGPVRVDCTPLPT